MIPLGIVLGRYETSAGGLLILVVAARFALLTLRERRAERNAGE